MFVPLRAFPAGTPGATRSGRVPPFSFFVSVILLSGLLAPSAWVSPAFATIEKMPVRVRIAGMPPGAERGRAMRTTLELSGNRTLMIENLRIEGDGWTGRIVSSRLATFALTKAAPVRVEIEVTPQDATAPVLVAFDVEGRTYRQELDLSPHSAEVRRGLPVRMGPTTEPVHPPVPEALLRVPAPEPAGPMEWAPEGFRGATRVAAPAGADARTIRVHGRFVYNRPDFGGGTVRIGADGLTFEVWDQHPGTNRLIRSGVTDMWGRFDTSFSWEDATDPNPDVFVIFRTFNGYVRVQPTGASEYYWYTPVQADYAGTDLDYGDVWPDFEGDQPALGILTDLMRDHRWYEANGILTIPHVTALWPITHSSISHYHPDLYEIHFTAAAGWNEGTHAHEYGHNFMNLIGITPEFEYCNEPRRCDDDPGADDCGHCGWCQENPTVQWIEGVPDWLSWAQVSTYEATYGVTPYLPENWESVSTCTDPLSGYAIDDPLQTEGFAAAVLQDIQDDFNENDGKGLSCAACSDQLSLGTARIFDVLILDHPLGLLSFVASFHARFPQYDEGLWSVCANNRMNFDLTPPGYATNLHPVGHVIGVPSADNTVRFTWTPAADDFSGILGYALTLTNTPGVPEPGTVWNIPDTTEFTTAPLEPGSWYLNLRAIDRATNSSPYVATVGPVVILPPEPVDLMPVMPSGWQEMLVPRPTGDATASSVPKPTYPLPGNLNSTYWNAASENYSHTSIATATWSTLYLDGVPVDSVQYGSYGDHEVKTKLNGGPLEVRGGRHAFAVKHDAKGAVAEIDETNNVRGRQWIWQPLAVAVNASVTRPAPPHPQGGASMLPLGLPYADCDGLRMVAGSGAGYWHAMVLSPELETGSIRANLHVATYSPDTGFGEPRASCSRGLGRTNAVLVNRHKVGGTMSWDVGALMEVESPSGFTARHIQSSTVTVGDSFVVTIPAGEYVKLYELPSGPPDTGWVSVRVTLLSGGGPLTAAWYRDEFQVGPLTGYSDVKVVSDSLETRVIDEEMDGGPCCVALWRDMKDGDRPVTVRVEVRAMGPDFTPVTGSGWYSPLVPTSSAVVYPGVAEAPTSLPGNAASTYLNLAVRNTSPVDDHVGPFARVYLDGVQSFWGKSAAIPGGLSFLFNVTQAMTVRGGRHSLTVRWDPDDLIAERSEDNNVFGEQWVWSPVSMTFANVLTRAAPPERTGGWPEVTSIPYGLYFNCDGLRTPSTNAGGNHDRYWVGVAVMPGDTSNVDVRLHDIEAGTQAGFRSSHGTSAWGVGQSDFCLGNYNLTGFHRLDVGVLKTSGSQDYTVEALTSKFLATNPDAVFGPYTLGAGHLAHLYEAWFDAGHWEVALEPGGSGGSIDWGLSVHPSSASYPVKSDVVADGLAYQAGPGSGESVAFTVVEPGYHAIVVWKSVSADAPLAGTYTLRIGPSLVDVAGRGIPASTRFGGAWPNPSRALTRLGFDLAREAHASLVVYDLRGARVRMLCDDVLPAGRHERVWDGADEGGRAVAPGIYLVRFEADGTKGVGRVVRLR